MYMCNSPVVRAEPLRFAESGVRDVVKDVFLPWYNAYRFLVQETHRFEEKGSPFEPLPLGASSNPMDEWLVASSEHLGEFVQQEMSHYRLYTVVPRLLAFLEDLTNWYVRMNRDRMRGAQGELECKLALSTLYHALLSLTVLMAPVTPFITELMYQNLAKALQDADSMKQKSVHFVMLPQVTAKAADLKILEKVKRMQAVVELGRTSRARRKIGLKMPVKSISVINSSAEFLDDVREMEQYIRDELNIMDIQYHQTAEKLVLKPMLNFKVLGKRLGKDMKAVKAQVETLSQSELMDFSANGVINVCGHVLTSEELEIKRLVEGPEDSQLEAAADAATCVIMDFTASAQLTRMALAREFTTTIQQMRKKTKLHPHDPVVIHIDISDDANGESNTSKMLQEQEAYIAKLVRAPITIGQGSAGDDASVLVQQTVQLEGSGGPEVRVAVHADPLAQGVPKVVGVTAGGD